MDNKKGRGMLTSSVTKLSESFMGKKITLKELRLIPYIDYVIKNNHCIDDDKIDIDERDILDEWEGKGWVKRIFSYISVTKEFYDFMQEVLWESYVNYEG